jgi:hypothetical protein
MITSSSITRRAALALLLCTASSSAIAAESAAPQARSPHYTPAGFFDMHVCNWPDRPPFLMLLFSTPLFAQVARIDVTYPDGRPLHTFDLGRYKSIQKKGKPDKRVFINELDLPAAAPNGWYHARITMEDGSVHSAKDFVVFEQLPRAQVVAPIPDSRNVPLPLTLIWQAVPGAQYYRVFIRDLWDDGRLVYESGLLKKPELRVPDGTLMPAGRFQPRIAERAGSVCDRGVTNKWRAICESNKSCNRGDCVDVHVSSARIRRGDRIAAREGD